MAAPNSIDPLSTSALMQTISGMIELAFSDDRIEETWGAARYVVIRGKEGDFGRLADVMPEVAQRIEALLPLIAQAPKAPAQNDTQRWSSELLDRWRDVLARKFAERLAMLMDAIHRRDIAKLKEALANFPPEEVEGLPLRFRLFRAEFDRFANGLGVPSKHRRTVGKLVVQMELSWRQPLLPFMYPSRVAA